MRAQDARRSLAKWLNEEIASPLDRVALATLLAEQDRLEAIAKAAQEPVAPHEQPFAYAYEYPYHLLAHGLNTIRFTNGEPINGYAPIRTVPVYTRPQPESAQVLVEALEDSQTLLAAMLHERRPAEEIENQIHLNHEALAAYKSEVKG